MSDHMRPGVECNCSTCGKVFVKTARGMKKKYCSAPCRKKAEADRMKPRVRAKVTAICLRCGVSFQCRSDARGMYCSKTCSNIANGAKADRDAIRKRLTGNKNCTGKKRPDAALRMVERNPMSSEETREKMRKSLSGRTFLSRGGNGQLTKPQKKLRSIAQPLTTLAPAQPPAQLTSKLSTEQRHDQLIKIVASEPEISRSELARRLGAARNTIKTDLETLESAGRIYVNGAIHVTHEG